MKRLLAIIVGAALALTPTVAVGATLVDAVPGQTITRAHKVNPAIEQFLDGRNIVTTNALEEGCAGQVISTGHLDADYACWLATGLRDAQR